MKPSEPTAPGNGPVTAQSYELESRGGDLWADVSFAINGNELTVSAMDPHERFANRSPRIAIHHADGRVTCTVYPGRQLTTMDAGVASTREDSTVVDLAVKRRIDLYDKSRANTWGRLAIGGGGIELFDAENTLRIAIGAQAVGDDAHAIHRPIGTGTSQLWVSIHHTRGHAPLPTDVVMP